MGSTRPNPESIPLAPDIYEVRLYYFNLNTLSEDGLDGDDAYTAILYPGSAIRPRVLKRKSA